MLVAVGLDQGVCRDPGRLPARAVVVQQLREGDRLLSQPGDVVVGREQLVRVAAEHRRAAGLQPNDPGAGPQVRTQHIYRTAQHPLRDVQLPGGDPSQSAAHRSVRHPYPPAGRLQHLHRRTGDARVKVVGEGIRPENDVPPEALAGRGAAGEPVLERLRREDRDVASLVDPAGGLGQAAEPGRVREGVDRTRQARRGGGHQRQPTHRVVLAGTQPAGVVVGQELGLVGGHVHVHRAVRLAALARQAQVERVPHRLGTPAVADRAAPGGPVEHLEQQAGPAAGGVLLLPRDHVGGAHDTAGVAAALADAHAAQHRLAEAAAVVGVGEDRLHGAVVVVHAQP
ncbi:hypothetical protein B0E53_06977 [Micromonospora sp. MH33]|nr:hypothetical protein B0E53_06977 [Micromonospora sp. MH33]